MTKDKALVLPPPNHYHGTYESSPFNYYTDDQMREYANLAAAHEREVCALVCEDLPAPPDVLRDRASVWDVATLDCAAAIRARSQS